MSVVASAVLDLRAEGAWSIGELLASAFSWPVDFELQRLDDVATRVEPLVFVDQGTKVLTPGGLDRLYGGIRRYVTKYQGPGFLVGGTEDNLQPGDLLIAASPGLPALMIGSSFLGSTVSGTFSAYRFSSIADVYWVWAVLSSTSGQRFLRSTMADSFSSRRLRLGDLLIPWPADSVRSCLSETIAEIEARTNRTPDEGSETWWSTADLRRIEWRTALATPDPDQLFNGTPLEDKGIEVSVGRAFGRSAEHTTPGQGLLPVVTGGVLASRPITRWLPETGGYSTAEAGDVLVASMGDRANARIAEQRVIVDTGVYRLRLPESMSAAPVVAFLNSQTGYSLRRLLLTGSTIQRLSIRDLKQLPIPADAFDTDGPVRTLAEQLELVLWTT